MAKDFLRRIRDAIKKPLFTPKAPRVPLTPQDTGVEVGPSDEGLDLLDWLTGEEESVEDEQLDNFLKGQWMYVISSNVAGARYDKEQAKLVIQFKSGATYSYYTITEDQALDFANSGSYGQWVWNNLRRPGVPFRRGG